MPAAREIGARESRATVRSRLLQAFSAGGRFATER
jgi:hypothetical protein